MKNNHSFRNVLFALFCVAVWDNVLAEDNQLLVIDGVATNFPGELFIVGDTGTNNVLIITNGGTVKDTAIWVGNDTTASNNAIFITGNGSSYEGPLTIGRIGTRNKLVISDGGRVRTSWGMIPSSDNVVVIDGTNSALTIFEYVFDVDGSSNQWLVINGGRVTSEGSIVDIEGANNLVHIAGEGSVWNGSGSLVIGLFGENNRLIISDGGQLTNRYDGLQTVILGKVGYATGNTVDITGAGSRMHAELIYVGEYGSSSNLFFVNNGGTLIAGDVYVGEGGEHSNVLCVSGTNSIATVQEGLYVKGTSCSLQILDGGRVISTEVGISGISNRCLVSAGAVLQNQAGVLRGSYNEVTVTGIGSAWINSSDLVIGPDLVTGRNVLNIESGGQVRSSQMTIGLGWVSESNRVEVIDGHLIVTNLSGTGTLEIPYGILTIRGGSVNADQLYVSGWGQINFERGLVSTKQAEITNGVPFVVGDGINPAILQLEGGTFNFGAGLIISSNAIVQGHGTILNNVTNYGTIAANQNGQKIVFDAYLSNQGQMLTTNGGGFFNITSLTKSADSVQVSLKGIQGLEFALEYKNSLLEDLWTTLLPFSPGTNGTMVLTDQAVPQSGRIYRVQAR